tara:strand:+ start:1239 stop:2522 length:1284 start_codon:yes stop_codon:yes gene_type:complete
VKRLQTQDGYFIDPVTNEPSSSIEAIVVDSGALSRNYYNTEGIAQCWSSEGSKPDDNVPVSTRQAVRCLDCPQNIRGASSYGRPCKFFSVITLVTKESKTVCSLRLGGNSLFAKTINNMTLQQYVDYLKSNSEELDTVLTEVYSVEANGFHRVYFKPARPLSAEEREHVKRLIEEDEESKDNPFNNGKQNMKNTSYILKDVEARYPRIDQPYRYDSNAGVKGKSVPCEAVADNAVYELDFVMTEPQAKDLYSAMNAAYKSARDDTWPEKLANPFPKIEGGYKGKARLKAAYNLQPTTPPPQFDADNKRLENGFLLTTGSTINVALELVPYKMSQSGVALRLRGVQVTNYLPYQTTSPFGVEEGFSANATPEEDDNIFGEVSEEEVVEAAPEEKPIKEPAKKAKKKEEATPSTSDDLVSAVFEEWGDD